MRSPALGDIEARHDFNSGYDGGLEADELFGELDRNEFAVDAVADLEAIFLWFEVDIGSTVLHGFFDDLVDEADDGGVFVFFDSGGGFFHGGDIGAFEAVEANTEDLGNFIEDGFAGSQIPLGSDAADSEDPFIHGFRGRPWGDKS